MQQNMLSKVSLARPGAYRTRAGRLFQQLFKSKPEPKKVRETVIPKPSYTLPTALLGIAGASHLANVDAVSWLAGILGAFLAFQASRVQFVFDDEALEVVVGKQQEETENAFVGGANRWRYDTFVNWEFWWPGFPVLVYFKETQTTEKDGGQIHFFPVLFDGKQLYDVMVERCGSSKTSSPKK
ncbi:hypothetical protein N2152v2_001068 [Parachlorella kessleri]